MYPKKERNDDKAAILKAQHKRDVIDSYVDKRRVAIAKQLNKLKTKGDFRYRTDQQIENLVPLWQEPKIKNKVKRGFKWQAQEPQKAFGQKPLEPALPFRKQRIEDALKKHQEFEELQFQNEIAPEGFYEDVDQAHEMKERLWENQ